MDASDEDPIGDLYAQAGRVEGPPSAQVAAFTRVIEEAEEQSWPAALWAAYARLARANLRRESGGVAEALVDYDSVIATFDSSDAEDPMLLAACWWGRAASYSLVDDAIDRALATVDELTQRFGAHEEDDVALYVAAAQLYASELQHAAGHHLDALSLVDQAVARIRPRYDLDAFAEMQVRAHDVRARVLSRAGRTQEAVDAIEEAAVRVDAIGEARLGPLPWTVRFHQATLLARDGRRAEALAVYDDIIGQRRHLAGELSEWFYPQAVARRILLRHSALKTTLLIVAAPWQPLIGRSRRFVQARGWIPK